MEHPRIPVQRQSTPPPACPVFSATLTPHRSLDARGFLILMGALCLVSFVTGLAFAWVGAWPVLGFFGLDVLLVYGAFKLSYRAARLTEHVDVDRERLTLLRVHPSGRRERFEFMTYWVAVQLDPQPDGRNALKLASHGRSVPFGQFLTNDERASFADALAQALGRARHGT